MSEEEQEDIEGVTEEESEEIKEGFTPELVRDLLNFAKEIRRETTKLREMDSVDTFFIEDKSRGRLIHFSSKKYDACQLANLGFECWNGFFNNGESKKMLGVD